VELTGDLSALLRNWLMPIFVVVWSLVKLR